MSALSDYLENKIVDWLLRGQAFTPPATVYVALLTVADNDAGGAATEVPINANTNYARAAIASSLANWAGTQGDGTTTVSSGATGQTSNNATVTFPAPGTTAWGSIVGFEVRDAATGGNLLWYGSLGTPKTVNANDAAPSFAAAAFKFQIDN